MLGAAVTKAVWRWHKDGHADQWDRIESPEINPYIYDQFMKFQGKGAKPIHWGMHSLQQMVLRQLDSHTQRMKLNPYLTPYIKTNSKWNNNLNIRVKTIKLLGENLGIHFHDPRLDNGFLAVTRKSQMTKDKIDKLDFIKIKKTFVIEILLRK